jgi:two-component system chemotaxis sensor kinase CheA
MTTDRDRLAQQLLATFVDELDGHIAALNRDLLALERGGSEVDSERLQSLFRTVHTIKGSSRAAGASLIEQATHHLEDVLSVLRDRLVDLAPPLFELLFGVTDAMAEAGERLRRGQPLEGAQLEGFLPRLVTVASGGRPNSSAPVPQSFVPPSAPASSSLLRLSPERIDDLVARSGELRVLYGRLKERSEQIAAFRPMLEGAIAHRERLRPRTSAFSELSVAAGEDAWTHAGFARAEGHAGTRAEVTRLLAQFDRVAGALLEDQRRVGFEIVQLDTAVRGLRMVPFEEACGGLERAVRDLSMASSKQAGLRVIGGEVELDRAVLDALRPSLLQLVRNAIDHGIETPAERIKGGKAEQGLITISAKLRGSEIVIRVEDDGRGVDLDAVRAQLQRRNISPPEREEDLARSVFTPGFSTARLITDISGRGVGLDVVKRALEALRGSVDLAFRRGQGTRFSLIVPLTLTTLRGLLVEVGDQTFVLPGTAIQRLLRIGAEDIQRVGGVQTIEVEGAAVPVTLLSELLGRPKASEPAQGKVPVVIVRAEGYAVGLVVDALLEERDVVVKNLGKRLRGARAVSGATVLPNGRLALILSSVEIVNRARRGASAAPVVVSDSARAQLVKHQILLVDDSITTRTLERSILEGAGYEVRTAVDGGDAWAQLQEHGADLVVSDVEMPTMDGFALTEAIRSSPRFRGLPVVLVTALASDADKARGLSVGANAYLVKSTFDQANLLETVAQLL